VDKGKDAFMDDILLLKFIQSDAINKPRFLAEAEGRLKI
jgi:hypothetical protein